MYPSGLRRHDKAISVTSCCVFFLTWESCLPLQIGELFLVLCFFGELFRHFWAILKHNFWKRIFDDILRISVLKKNCFLFDICLRIL